MMVRALTRDEGLLIALDLLSALLQHLLAPSSYFIIQVITQHPLDQVHEAAAKESGPRDHVAIRRDWWMR
jgi:hypothetical protein